MGRLAMKAARTAGGTGQAGRFLRLHRAGVRGAHRRAAERGTCDARPHATPAQPPCPAGKVPVRRKPDTGVRRLPPAGLLSPGTRNAGSCSLPCSLQNGRDAVGS